MLKWGGPLCLRIQRLGGFVSMVIPNIQAFIAQS